MCTDESQVAFREAMRQISFLPEDQRIDALMGYFVEVLSKMDTETLRQRRDQLMERFATCGSSYETCQLVIEFINGHLELRELSVAHRR